MCGQEDGILPPQPMVAVEHLGEICPVAEGDILLNVLEEIERVSDNDDGSKSSRHPDDHVPGRVPSGPVHCYAWSNLMAILSQYQMLASSREPVEWTAREPNLGTSGFISWIPDIIPIASWNMELSPTVEWRVYVVIEMQVGQSDGIDIVGDKPEVREEIRGVSTGTKMLPSDSVGSGVGGVDAIHAGIDHDGASFAAHEETGQADLHWIVASIGMVKYSRARSKPIGVFEDMDGVRAHAGITIGKAGRVAQDQQRASAFGSMRTDWGALDLVERKFA